MHLNARMYGNCPNRLNGKNENVFHSNTYSQIPYRIVTLNLMDRKKKMEFENERAEKDLNGLFGATEVREVPCLYFIYFIKNRRDISALAFVFSYKSISM